MKFADFFSEESRELLMELQLPAFQQHDPLSDKPGQQLLKVRLSYMMDHSTMHLPDVWLIG